MQLRVAPGSATRLGEPNGQSALHDPRNWRELRLRPDEGGALPGPSTTGGKSPALSGSSPTPRAAAWIAIGASIGGAGNSWKPAKRSSNSPGLASVPTCESSLATWFRDRFGSLQGRTRRIAIVAFARELLIGNLARRHAGPRTGRGDHRRRIPSPIDQRRIVRGRDRLRHWSM